MPVADEAGARMGAGGVDGAQAALLGPGAPQWPQLPPDGQGGPLMATVTSQQPQHPLNGCGATQGTAFGGTGVTLSPQSLQMHLSQVPALCSGVLIYSLHHLEKSLSRLFLLLPPPPCVWLSFTCCPHKAQLDVPHAPGVPEHDQSSQGLPLAQVSTCQEGRNQCPAPSPNTSATPPSPSLPPKTGTKRGRKLGLEKSIFHEFPRNGN